MSMTTSFLGEYSVGLSIVPAMKELLHLEYDFVTPIFPWMTREGSKISNQVHQKDRFLIFGIYPRRPKLTTDSDEIEIKINEQIISGAKGGDKLGIPIIAGCPLVKNFWELSNKPDFLWINIDNNEAQDFIFRVKGLETLPPVLQKMVFKESQEILDYIKTKAKLFSIGEALYAFREIKMTSIHTDYYPRLGFGGIYKPIYFLLKNKIE